MGKQPIISAGVSAPRMDTGLECLFRPMRGTTLMPLLKKHDSTADKPERGRMRE